MAPNIYEFTIPSEGANCFTGEKRAEFLFRTSWQSRSLWNIRELLDVWLWIAKVFEESEKLETKTQVHWKLLKELWYAFFFIWVGKKASKKKILIVIQFFALVSRFKVFLEIREFSHARTIKLKSQHIDKV